MKEVYTIQYIVTNVLWNVYTMHEEDINQNNILIITGEGGTSNTNLQSSELQDITSGT